MYRYSRGYIVMFILSWNMRVSHAESAEDVKKLKNHLLSNYDREIQPVYDSPMDVNVVYAPLSIRELDELSGTLKTGAGFHFYWKDSRLSWNVSEYNMTNIPIKSSRIWYPEFVCSNPADKTERLVDDYISAHVSFDGSVSIKTGVAIRSSCDVDMTYFPFDTQRCKIEISTWGITPNILLRAENKSINLKYFNKNPRWELVGATIENVAQKSRDGYMYVELSLRRKPQYLVVTSLSPILLLFALNPLIFLLPIESGERISFSITMLLSLAVFMTLVGDNMPRSANPVCLLSYFLLAAMISSTLQCVIVTFIIMLYFKEETKPIPDWVLTTQELFQCRKKCQIEKENGKSENKLPKDFREKGLSWKDLASLLDTVAFVFSCLVVAVIVVIIMGIYL